MGVIVTVHLPLPVKANKAGKQEHLEVLFLLERGTPIPRARESAVDATTRVEEVVGTRAIKRVPEKVSEDVEIEPVERAELGVYVSTQGRLRVYVGEFTQRRTDWEENSVNLRVLIYEHKGVWDIVITHMDH